MAQELRFQNRIVLIVLSFIAVALAGLGIFLYLQNQRIQNEIDQLRNPSSYAEELQEQNQLIVDTLGQHLLLPEGETPTIYSITDIDHARAAYGDFFEHAENGDRLVLYQNKAVIYRFEQDLIINVGPVAYLSEE